MTYIREYTDADLKTVADLLSQKAIKRETGEWSKLNIEESKKMRQIVYGALLSARWNHAEPSIVQGILDYAEWIFNLMLPDYEGYRSIYLPLDFVLDRTLTETRVDEDKVRRYLNEN